MVSSWSEVQGPEEKYNTSVREVLVFERRGKKSAVIHRREIGDMI